jgi:hypothetical protein
MSRYLRTSVCFLAMFITDSMILRFPLAWVLRLLWYIHVAWCTVWINDVDGWWATTFSQESPTIYSRSFSMTTYTLWCPAIEELCVTRNSTSSKGVNQCINYVRLVHCLVSKVSFYRLQVELDLHTETRYEDGNRSKAHNISQPTSNNRSQIQVTLSQRLQNT